MGGSGDVVDDFGNPGFGVRDDLAGAQIREVADEVQAEGAPGASLGTDAAQAGDVVGAVWCDGAAGADDDGLPGLAWVMAGEIGELDGDGQAGHQGGDGGAGLGWRWGGVVWRGLRRLGRLAGTAARLAGSGRRWRVRLVLHMLGFRVQIPREFEQSGALGGHYRVQRGLARVWREGLRVWARRRFGPALAGFQGQVGGERQGEQEQAEHGRNKPRSRPQRQVFVAGVA